VGSLRSFRADYFSLLGVGGEEEVARAICGKIEAELERARSSFLPVKLSAVAGAFQIEPKPYFDEKVLNGRLRAEEGGVHSRSFCPGGTRGPRVPPSLGIGSPMRTSLPTGFSSSATEPAGRGP
jgi:hypothetical protein